MAGVLGLFFGVFAFGFIVYTLKFFFGKYIKGEDMGSFFSPYSDEELAFRKKYPGEMEKIEAHIKKMRKEKGWGAKEAEKYAINQIKKIVDGK